MQRRAIKPRRELSEEQRAKVLARCYDFILTLPVTRKENTSPDASSGKIAASGGAAVQPKETEHDVSYITTDVL